MFIFNEFKLGNFFILQLHLFVLSFNVVLENEFIEIKKLSLYDSYFVVLDTGLYLYNFNSPNCSIIESFNTSVYKWNNNRVILNELNYSDHYYILCIVNKYLFIFNESNNKTCSFILDIFDNSYNHYYELLPYRFDKNNISFIIVNAQENSKFIFYFYNFSLDEKISKPKEKYFNEINVENNLISCQINSYLSFIKCFYYRKDNKYQNHFSYSNFTIEYMNILLQGTQDLINTNEINQIKSAKSLNNNFFICLTELFIPSCYINNFLTNEFKKIDCNIKDEYNTDYKVLYFEETNDFMFISRLKLITTLFNNNNYTVESCEADRFRHQENDYSIIYNNLKNHFSIIKNMLNYVKN